MRKNLTFFCGLALSLCLAGSAVAQNASSYFMIDTDLTTAGYQSTSMASVKDIGASKLVGFAIYGLSLENVAGYTITFEWDATKAEFREGSSGADMADDDVTINGSSITLAAEGNAMGAFIESPATSETGKYSKSIARQGAGATPGEGLFYYGVFRTSSSFTTEDTFNIKVSVEIMDSDLNRKFIGYRYFNVNQVAVKNATWGDVKSQFKDF